MSATHGLTIRLRGVVKRYGPLTAVDGLNLDVPTGTCVGLLGPNGAGKSTTMRLLTAQAIADEGELDVLGYELPRESKQARALCGVVPQLDNLDVSLTVEQNLLVFSHLYRIGRHDRKEAIARAIEIARLGDRKDTKVDRLSGGMRRRLLERAGTSSSGSITGLYTVLVEGDDMNDPVADAVRGILDGHVVLSRALAHRSHYPAIDVLQSVSRLTGEVTSPERRAAESHVRELLALHREKEDLISIGAYARGSDSRIDRAIDLMPQIESFLRQPITERVDADASDAALVDLAAG